jgi:hypothetical protein
MVDSPSFVLGVDWPSFILAVDSPPSILGLNSPSFALSDVVVWLRCALAEQSVRDER